MKRTIASIICAASLCTACQEASEPITIHMIGDSTMANKRLDNGNLERGWGQMFQALFDEHVTVANYAVNGRSTKSFIDEGRWQTVLDSLRAGDYLIIQFGHNDEKVDSARHTDPGSTFDANLRRFVVEAKAKGATPILMNSIVRRNFGKNPNAIAADDVRQALALAPDEEGDTLVETHGDYLLSPRRVARETGVEFIDMNAMTRQFVQSLGRDGSKQIYMWVEPGVSEACPDGRQDNTHLNVSGARTISQMVLDSLVAHIPALAPHAHKYDFVVAQDGSGDFFTVGEAMEAANCDCCARVLVRKGFYDEEINEPDSRLSVTIYGEKGAEIARGSMAKKLKPIDDKE